MSAEMTTAEPYRGWPTLLDVWQETEVRAGWRAEIVWEGITVTPPPGNGHNSIAGMVNRALVAAAPDGSDVYQTVGLAIPLRLQLFVPDLAVVPCAELVGRPDNEPVPADRALLVVEITSRGNADTDRRAKRWGYAHAGVPQYLLIDRFHDEGPTVTLLSDPADGHYRHTVISKFGEPVRLLEPFGFDLDTGGFPGR